VPVTLTPLSVAYTSQTVGSTSNPKILTLTNNQGVSVNNIAISATGDFAVTATSCTTSLAAKNKCTISVVFTPTATGTRTGNLQVNDSAANSPQASSLSGTGVPGTLGIGHSFRQASVQLEVGYQAARSLSDRA
jgi:hypothetical protein